MHMGSAYHFICLTKALYENRDGKRRKRYRPVPKLKTGHVPKYITTLT